MAQQQANTEETEVFRINVSANRNAIRTLLGQLEVKLSDDTLRSLASLISQQVGQLQTAPTAMTAKERSLHASLGGQTLPTDLGLLIDTRDATKLLKVSSRKLWQMYNSGEMPKPIKIGRMVRWSYAELQEWVDSGCPRADRWKYKPG